MASYVKLGEGAWRSITDHKGMVVADSAKDNIEYFEYEDIAPGPTTSADEIGLEFD
jgi:hypothetical protein